MKIKFDKEKLGKERKIFENHIKIVQPVLDGKSFDSFSKKERSKISKSVEVLMDISNKHFEIIT